MKRYNLKMFRIMHDLTQQDIANKLGISKSHYVSIEQGTQDPSFKVLEQFAKVFEYDDIWQIMKKGK